MDVERDHRSPRAIRPLMYNPSDYQLMIRIFERESGRRVFTKMVRGENVPSFFKNVSVSN